MVEGEAEREPVARDEGTVIEGHGLPHDGTNTQDGGFGRVDDRGEGLDPETAEVAECEAGAVHVDRGEFARTGLGDEPL